MLIETGELPMHANFHFKSNIKRLYTSRNESGWGIQECIIKVTPKDKLLKKNLNTGTSTNTGKWPSGGDTIANQVPTWVVPLTDT